MLRAAINRKSITRQMVRIDKPGAFTNLLGKWAQTDGTNFILFFLFIYFGNLKPWPSCMFLNSRFHHVIGLYMTVTFELLLFMCVTCICVIQVTIDHNEWLNSSHHGGVMQTFYTSIPVCRLFASRSKTFRDFMATLNSDELWISLETFRCHRG